MTRKSRSLILIACSNTKSRAGESPAYDQAAAISAVLDSNATQLLLEGRQRVHEIRTRLPLSRTGRPLLSLPYNKGLVPGPDFGVPEVHPRARYLAAAQRYRGRFFTELGTEPLTALADSPHHVLIVSALYGLLPPGGRVLHAFSPQFAGDALLRPLGAAAPRLLAAPAEALQALRPGHVEQTPYEDVLLEATSIPGSGRNLAREVERQQQRLTTADMIGRMRRNYLRILDRLDPAHSDYREGFPARIERLSAHGLPADVAARMRRFNTVRNNVEYRGEAVSAERWRTLVDDHPRVTAWARRTLPDVKLDEIESEG